MRVLQLCIPQQLPASLRACVRVCACACTHCLQLRVSLMLVACAAGVQRTSTHAHTCRFPCAAVQARACVAARPSSAAAVPAAPAVACLWAAARHASAAPSSAGGYAGSRARALHACARVCRQCSVCGRGGMQGQGPACKRARVCGGGWRRAGGVHACTRACARVGAWGRARTRAAQCLRRRRGARRAERTPHEQHSAGGWGVAGRARLCLY